MRFVLEKDPRRRLEVDEEDGARPVQRVPVADKYLRTCLRRGERDDDGAISSTRVRYADGISRVNSRNVSEDKRGSPQAPRPSFGAQAVTSCDERDDERVQLSRCCSSATTVSGALPGPTSSAPSLCPSTKISE